MGPVPLADVPVVGVPGVVRVLAAGANVDQAVGDQRRLGVEEQREPDASALIRSTISPITAVRSAIGIVVTYRSIRASISAFM